jgi:hypothetical protein
VDKLRDLHDQLDKGITQKTAVSLLPSRLGSFHYR